MDWAQIDCIIKNKIKILWMRKITVLKVLATEIVYLILLKEETGVDYVVTIDKARIEDNHFGWTYWFSDSTTCRESTI